MPLLLLALAILGARSGLPLDEPELKAISAEDLFRNAQASAHRGDHEQAERLYRQLLTAHPLILPARVNLGLECYWRHKNREAIDEFQKALKLRPREYSALLFSGLAYLDLGEHDLAQKQLFTAARVEDREPLLFWALGSLAMIHGDADDAVYLLERSVALGPESVPSVWLLGQAYARLAYRKGKQPEVPADYAGLAEKTLQWLESRQPDSPPVHVLMGDVFAARDLTSKALTEYRRAEQLDPNWPGIHVMIGSLLGALGRWDEALAELHVQLRTSPDDPRTLTEKGSVLCRADRYQEALPVLQKALGRDHSNYEAAYRLGQVYVNLGEYASALEPLERATHLEPDKSDPYYLFHRAYRALQQPEKADWALQQFNQRKGAQQ
jgi:tetratricopeptide (TPR) repeat protein